MSGRVREPNYPEFAYGSGLMGTKRIDLDRLLGRFVLEAPDVEGAWLTEEDVHSLINSTIVPSPFACFVHSEFAAPKPIKFDLPPRPADPMYSGKWGQPVQTEIPPEPKITLTRANLTLFGFRLTPINRYLDEKRKQNAGRRLAKLREEWDKKFKKTKIENQQAILDFERRVQGDPDYSAYLAAERRWLQIAADAEAEYQSALERWGYHCQSFHWRTVARSRAKSVRSNILNFQAHEIAASQLAVDRQIKHCEVAQPMLDLQLRGVSPRLAWSGAGLGTEHVAGSRSDLLALSKASGPSNSPPMICTSRQVSPPTPLACARTAT